MKGIESIHQMIRSNNKYLYKGKVVVFIGLSEHQNSNEISINVLIDGKPKTFVKENSKKLDLFLINFKPIKPDKVAISGPISELPAKVEPVKGPAILQKHTNTFSKLANMLMDDMEKVREKPEYVSQAKQSANTANAIINLAKLELQMLTNG